MLCSIGYRICRCSNYIGGGGGGDYDDDDKC